VLTDGPVLVWGTATPDSSDTAFAVPNASNSDDHTGKENGHGLTQLDQYALPGRAASS
jgi:hypothetical protein